MGKNISAYVDDDLAEWLDEADVNKSQLIEDLLREKRQHMSDSREEILERKKEEKEQEIAENERKTEMLKEELAQIEAELESVRDERAARVDEVIEQLARATTVPADERSPDAFTEYAGECGMTADEFAELVEHIDLHSLNPTYKWEDKREEDRVQDMLQTHHLYEANIIPSELRDVADDADSTRLALRTLTEEQEELARDWFESRD